MNIFLLHENPDTAATGLCRKHVNKMTLEAVQIANTGLHLADLSEYAFYQKTHKDHPWCEFAARSFDHFNFVRKHAQAIGREFLRRHDGRHTSHEKVEQHWTHDELTAIAESLGRAESEQVWDDIPQAMPEQYYNEDPIIAYREYYRNEKWPKDWCTYEEVTMPDWIAQGTPLYRWI